MISKNDVVLLLTELQSKGIDVSNELNLLFKSPSVPLDVLKKINDNRQLDVSRFYDKLRYSYNHKKSKLYINIVRVDENTLNDPKSVLTTLSALLNQILQFDAADKTMFYTHSRTDEIVKVLEIYFKTFNIEPANKLLHLIKADLKACEMISGKVH